MHCGSQAPFGAGPRCLTTPARRTAMSNATLCVSMIHNEPGNQVTPVARHPPTPGLPLRFGKQSLISPSGFPSSAYCCPTRRPRGTRARGPVPENAKVKWWKEYKRNHLSCLGRSSASLGILNTSWRSVSKCALRLPFLFSPRRPPHKQLPDLTVSVEALTTRDPARAALDTAARPTSGHNSIYHSHT